jgi:hypothetical protein
MITIKSTHDQITAFSSAAAVTPFWTSPRLTNPQLIATDFEGVIRRWLKGGLDFQALNLGLMLKAKDYGDQLAADYFAHGYNGYDD